MGWGWDAARQLTVVYRHARSRSGVSSRRGQWAVSERTSRVRRRACTAVRLRTMRRARTVRHWWVDTWSASRGSRTYSMAGRPPPPHAHPPPPSPHLCAAMRWHRRSQRGRQHRRLKLKAKAREARRRGRRRPHPSPGGWQCKAPPAACGCRMRARTASSNAYWWVCAAPCPSAPNLLPARRGPRPHSLKCGEAASSPHVQRRTST